MTAELLPPVGLREYSRAVAEQLGADVESVTVACDPRPFVRIAVEGRAPSEPRRDLALLWDERHGCAAAVAGEKWNVLGYLGGVRAVAAPAEVERFMTGVLSGWTPTMRPPEFAPTNDLDEYRTRET